MAGQFSLEQDADDFRRNIVRVRFFYKVFGKFEAIEFFLAGSIGGSLAGVGNWRRTIAGNKVAYLCFRCTPRIRPGRLVGDRFEQQGARINFRAMAANRRFGCRDG